MSKINCFISSHSPGVMDETVAGLLDSSLVNRVYMFGEEAPVKEREGSGFIKTDGKFSTDTIRKIADHSNGADFSLILMQETRIRFGMLALERFLEVASGTGAGMVYSDHFDVVDRKLKAHPVIDYQAGSLRDDFEFGPVLFFNSSALIQAAGGIKESLEFAGLYQLRLKVSQQGLPWRIPEYLYTVEALDTRASGKKMFDYVDPKNRAVQVEMEKAATTHLKEIGG